MTNTRRDTLFVLSLYVVFGALLYSLVWDLRPYPFLGWVDDYRYVKSAWYLRDLQWLGPFDATTLVKRPFFSVILAVTAFLEVPFDPFQMLFYLAGVGFFVHILLRLRLPKWIAVLLFATLAYVPTIYDSDGSRVFRETVTVGIEFIVFGLAARLLLLPKETRPQDLLWGQNRKWLYQLYGLAAFHWGLREEGILLEAVLLPFLCLIALWRFRGSILQRVAGGAAVCAGLLACIAAAYLAIASANYAAYGVFLVNDLSDGEFPKLVGVLKSIQEGPRPELLLHPTETGKLMEMSPRFRQIGGVLQRVQETSPGVGYSFSMFFLRVTGLQNTELGSSAENTQQFFRELREEISELCGRGELKCDPEPGFSVLPRYTADQWRLVPVRFRQLSTWLLTTTNSGFEFLSKKYPGVESVPPAVLEHFVDITRQEPFGWDGEQTEYTLPGPLDEVLNQQKRREAMGVLYSRGSPVVYGMAAIALFFFVPWAWRTGRYEWLAILAVLWMHVGVRIVAFSYLAAVDEGGIPVRLIRPAYPFALASAVLVLGLTVSLAWEKLRKSSQESA